MCYVSIFSGFLFLNYKKGIQTMNRKDRVEIYIHLKGLKSKCKSPTLIEVFFKLNLLLKLNPSILCVQQHHKKAISVEK